MKFAKRATPSTGSTSYECHVIQPLDAAWQGSPACLAGEQAWTSYTVPWGVLARDEAEASEIVLNWQGRCYPLAARIESLELSGSGYTDCIGIVWQGMRDGQSSDTRD